MNYLHKQRLFFIIVILLTVFAATALAFYALKQNINFFYNPSELVAGQAPLNREFRLGGLVARGSVRHLADSLTIVFEVTDNKNRVMIHYTGVLPDLFREGQAVVVEGKLNRQGVFMADQVLAKHDERYMPAVVVHMLK